MRTLTALALAALLAATTGCTAGQPHEAVPAPDAPLETSAYHDPAPSAPTVPDPTVPIISQVPATATPTATPSLPASHPPVSSPPPVRSAPAKAAERKPSAHRTRPLASARPTGTATKPSATRTSSSRPTATRPGGAPTRAVTPRPPRPSRPAATPRPPAPPAAPGVSGKVLGLVNRERASAGCGPLRVDARLVRASEAHSRDMAANGYFDHVSLDGRTPRDRMAAAGYPSPGAENIALGYPNAEAVMRGWMNSPGHRANILNCGLTAMGVAAVNSPRGLYWTQTFGW